MHMDALVHTRQSKPPARMKTVYVPFVVKSVSSTRRNGGETVIEVNIWLATKSDVFIMWNFNSSRFKADFDEEYKHYLLGQSDSMGTKKKFASVDADSAILSKIKIHVRI